MGLYPWRWQEESTLKEIKEVMLKGEPAAAAGQDAGAGVEQEFYGLLLAPLRGAVGDGGGGGGGAGPSRLSFKRGLEVLEDHLGWSGRVELSLQRRLRRLVAEVGRQRLRVERRGATRG